VDAGSSQKMRPNKKQAFSDEVDTGSSQKMRPNKKLARLSHEGTAVIALARDRPARRKAG